jgi:hypothetical protein
VWRSETGACASFLVSRHAPWGGLPARRRHAGTIHRGRRAPTFLVDLSRERRWGGPEGPRPRPWPVCMLACSLPLGLA